MEKYESISFRDTVRGKVADILKDSGFSDAYIQEEVFQLIEKLKGYTDEGRSYTPSIYVLKNDKSVRSFEGTVTHRKIGSVEKRDGSLGRVLKYCAPLSSGGWSIYIYEANSGSKDVVCYGVAWTDDFLERKDPVAPLESIDGIVLYSLMDSAICLGSGDDCGAVIHFSTVRGKKFKPFEEPDRFIGDCVRSGAGEKETARDAIKNIIYAGISSKHGFLAAVVKGREELKSLEEDHSLSSVIILDSSINILEVSQTYESDKTAKNVGNLSALLSLAKGMLSMDGITFFSQEGEILGYYGFVNVGGSSKSQGGARSRAFSELKNLVEANKIISVLKQSQDGQSEYFCYGS